METLVKNAANLLKVKTLVTVAVLYVFVRLALTGEIPPDSVTNTCNMVIAFYFGTQHEKR